MWATGAALTSVLLMTAILVGVVMVNGLGVFWPDPVAEIRLADGSQVLGELVERETNPGTGVRSRLVKIGNRELNNQQDFRWFREDAIEDVSYPAEVFALERIANGNFYGFLVRVEGPDIESPRLSGKKAELDVALEAAQERRDREIEPLARRIASLSREIQALDDSVRHLEYRWKHVSAESASDTRGSAQLAAELAELRETKLRVGMESDACVAEKIALERELRTNVAVFRAASGQTHEVALLDVVRAFQPNAMGVMAKARHYAGKVKELLVTWPRESNTEGGLLPAIFGTVMLVFLMAATCFPLGVLAGVYLGEYAKEGVLVRLVRIAVNNLAGIPSIVYGIFGLGFFVYGIGAAIDRIFFPESVDAGQPVFGTGGVLWASLTLGLLTVPVVIVATEEALRTIPRGFREGSYALGATKFQTLRRVLVPMASPGIMTGFILAMARAAGEVAPLMVTGAIKIVSDLPVDGRSPFFHPDRKFMHLGFHIYDIGFQSPNIEATKPMVYVTTMLLVLIVLVMSSAAIFLRNRMRKRFQSRSI